MLVGSSDWSPMIKKLEVKPLCNLILDKSITDTGKYQMGLTKIFFRAGMLAYLESMRSERLNAMVTVVQKNMRRKMAMKKYQAMRKAAIRIQTWWRSIMAKALAARLRREAAALRLQTAIRAYLQRQRFIRIRIAIIGIQSCKFRIFVTTTYINTFQVLEGGRLAIFTKRIECCSEQHHCKVFSAGCESFNK